MSIVSICLVCDFSIMTTCPSIPDARFAFFCVLFVLFLLFVNGLSGEAKQNRHLVGKKDSTKQDTINDITSDSKMNRYFPYR